MRQNFYKIALLSFIPFTLFFVGLFNKSLGSANAQDYFQSQYSTSKASYNASLSRNMGWYNSSQNSIENYNYYSNLDSGASYPPYSGSSNS